MPLTLKISGISMWRWQMQTSMEAQWAQQEAMGQGGDTDIIRRHLEVRPSVPDYKTAGTKNGSAEIKYAPT